jgi:putative Holliday junction resolvase
MKHLALDVGERRVGVAVSDEMAIVATPLMVIRRRSKAEDFAIIAALVREHGVGGLVIGHPLDSEGKAGFQAQRVERYAQALVERLQAEGLELALSFWDEYLSTRHAQEVMIATKRRAKDRRDRLDAVAAAVILQDYLDTHRPGRGDPAPTDSTDGGPPSAGGL